MRMSLHMPVMHISMERIHAHVDLSIHTHVRMSVRMSAHMSVHIVYAQAKMAFNLAIYSYGLDSYGLYRQI